jgi:hypothetical protein
MLRLLESGLRLPLRLRRLLPSGGSTQLRLGPGALPGRNTSSRRGLQRPCRRRLRPLLSARERR